MGLLGNVSECAHLRYRLMKEDYILRFIGLLDSQSDGIEVSYNSAGILAHIASDGAEVWNRNLNQKCDRDDMLRHMEQAITRWDINSKRNINYRYLLTKWILFFLSKKFVSDLSSQYFDCCVFVPFHGRLNIGLFGRWQI